MASCMGLCRRETEQTCTCACNCAQADVEVFGGCTWPLYDKQAKHYTCVNVVISCTSIADVLPCFAHAHSVADVYCVGKDLMLRQGCNRVAYLHAI